MARVYAFRVGSRARPTRIISFRTRNVAEGVRQARKREGETTGRLKHVTTGVAEGARAAVAEGYVPDGW